MATKDPNQNKQQQPMRKPDRGGERQPPKTVGNDNVTDEDLDEQGEITQRNPRVSEDIEHK